MSKDTIKLLMLDSGEHILGFVKSDDGHEIVVEKPASLVPNGQQGVGLMAYLQFAATDTCTFPHRIVRHVLTPETGLLEGYYKQFGAGIITPQAGNGPGGIALV